MSTTGNIDAGIHQERLNRPTKTKATETTTENRETSATGLQWAAQAAAVQQAVTQQAVSTAKPVQDKAGIQQKPQSRQLEIQATGVDDIAILSTSTAIKEESVAAVEQKGISAFLRRGFNMAALEEAYRETFKKSKSHNLLLERFMANVKFSAMKGLFSILGISAEAQDEIQREVRKKALAEIDSRLKNEWAYSKALLEIVG